MGPQEGGEILEISQQRVTGLLEPPAALPLLVHLALAEVIDLKSSGCSNEK
jgi:hypothetical protein